MDSVTQIALGAAVSVAAMGHRTAVWKAAAWGAVAGTLPDLDVLIDHGDPIANMVLHRAETHAPFWLTLFSLPMAAAVAWLHGEQAHWRRWWLAIWLALVTHPLLDALTIYGTQLALPFSNHPYGVGSVFIIDPLVTLPWLAGTIWALVSKGTRRGLRANVIGLVLGASYLAWGVYAQQQVASVAHASLTKQGIATDRVLVTPTAFNTLLWRVVAMQADAYYEGFYSLRDEQPSMAFERFDQDEKLATRVAALPGARNIAAFSKGFYKVQDDAGKVSITDLRMGQEPTYTFNFVVAERHSDLTPIVPTRLIMQRPDIGRALPWLWQRAMGQTLAPLR